MNMRMRKFLFWIPRILCILFALFLGLLFLDVFDENLGLLESVLALLIHLIPAYIVIAVLLLAWRREWIGAILFTALAVFYIV